VGTSYNTLIHDRQAIYLGTQSSPLATYDTEVSCDSSIWWFDQNETVYFTVWVKVRSGQGDSWANISGILLRLYIGDKFIPLADVAYTPQLSIPNITSLNAETVQFETTLSINITMRGYEFLVSPLRPKLEGNLAYLISISSRGEREHSIRLSNYYDTGITGWTPTLIPIVIDNPVQRTWGSVFFISGFLVPGGLYCLGYALTEKERLAESDKWHKLVLFYRAHQMAFYYCALGGFSLFISLLLAITYGSLFFFVFPDARYWFSLIVTILLGLSVTVSLTGFVEINLVPSFAERQYRNYVNITKVGNIRCRTKTALEEYERWISISLEDIPLHYYNLAQTRTIWLFLLVLSGVSLYGIPVSQHPYPILILDLVSSLVSSVMFAYSVSVSRELQELYAVIRMSWHYYWFMLHVLTSKMEYMAEQIDLPVSERIGKKITADEKGTMVSNLYEIYMDKIRPAILELETDKPRSVFEQAVQPLEQIREHENEIRRLEDEGRPFDFKVLQEVVPTFASSSQKETLVNLLRRVVYVYLGLLCVDLIPELIEDLGELVFGNKRDALENSIFVARIGQIYEEFVTIPPKLKLSNSTVVRNLRFVWAFLSPFIGYPVSTFLWWYV